MVNSIALKQQNNNDEEKAEYEYLLFVSQLYTKIKISLIALSTQIFDDILNEFLTSFLLTGKNIRIEINFMNGKADYAYPNFVHELICSENSLLVKAEISAFLYLHYKIYDIEDDYIDYVILTISFE